MYSRDCTFAPRHEIVRLYVEEGLSMAAIAELVGASVAGVSYQLDKAGIKRRKNGSNLRNPDVVAKAFANRQRGTSHHSFRNIPLTDIQLAYESGESTQTIADRHNVSARTIARKLEASGVRLRPSGFPILYNNLPVGLMCTAYEAGVSTVALAGQYGVSKTTIENQLRSIGLDLRKSGWHRRFTTIDGHAVQSAWELLADNWLFVHGIEHECHPVLPFGRNAHDRADFLSKNYYIELWGMLENKRYAERHLAKLRAYEEHGLQLINLLPHHILFEDCSPLHILL